MPSISSEGNDSPASMTRREPSDSTTNMLRPTSPSPPRKTTRVGALDTPNHRSPVFSIAVRMVRASSSVGGTSGRRGSPTSSPSNPTAYLTGIGLVVNPMIIDISSRFSAKMRCASYYLPVIPCRDDLFDLRSDQVRAHRHDPYGARRELWKEQGVVAGVDLEVGVSGPIELRPQLGRLARVTDGILVRDDVRMSGQLDDRLSSRSDGSCAEGRRRAPAGYRRRRPRRGSALRDRSEGASSSTA